MLFERPLILRRTQRSNADVLPNPHTKLIGSMRLDRRRAVCRDRHVMAVSVSRESENERPVTLRSGPSKTRRVAPNW
jgi:hypothetical protein